MKDFTLDGQSTKIEPKHQWNEPICQPKSSI